MHAVINQERTALRSLADQVRSISDSNYYEYNAIAIMGGEIAKFVQLHDEVQTFKEGVADLVHGLLTPGLISLTEINAAITDMTQRLLSEKRGKMLCYKAPQDVYASGYFDYARHGHELFVRIRVPYTRSSHVFAYRSRVIPLPVPGEQGLVTKLKDFPQIFVTMAYRIGELKEIPSSGIVDEVNVRWYPASQKTCAQQVFNDLPGRVQQNCDFVTQKGVIEPEAIRLADGVFLLTNSSMAGVECNGMAQTTVRNCTPCIVTLNCNCTLDMGGGLELIKRSDDSVCPSDQEGVSVAHAINLIVLQTFYEMGNTNSTAVFYFIQTRSLKQVILCCHCSVTIRRNYWQVTKKQAIH